MGPSSQAYYYLANIWANVQESWFASSWNLANNTYFNPAGTHVSQYNRVLNKSWLTLLNNYLALALLQTLTVFFARSLIFLVVVTVLLPRSRFVVQVMLCALSNHVAFPNNEDLFILYGNWAVTLSTIFDVFWELWFFFFQFFVYFGQFQQNLVCLNCILVQPQLYFAYLVIYQRFHLILLDFK